MKVQHLQCFLVFLVVFELKCDSFYSKKTELNNLADSSAVFSTVLRDLSREEGILVRKS
jgi:hypothetical protein